MREDVRFQPSNAQFCLSRRPSCFCCDVPISRDGLEAVLDNWTLRARAGSWITTVCKGFASCVSSFSCLRKFYVIPFAEGERFALARKSVVQPPELRARRCDQQVEAISSDSLYRLCLGSALFTPNAARGTDGILFLALAAIPSKVPSGVLRRARYHAHSGRELSEISGHLRVLQRACG